MGGRQRSDGEITIAKRVVLQARREIVSASADHGIEFLGKMRDASSPRYLACQSIAAASLGGGRGTKPASGAVLLLAGPIGGDDLQEVPGRGYQRGPSDALVSWVIKERGADNSGELSAMVYSFFVGGSVCMVTQS